MKILHFDSSILIPYINAKIKAPLKRKEDAKIRERAVKFVDSCRLPVKISIATFGEILRNYPEDADALQQFAETVPSAPLELKSRDARRWARLQNRSKLVMGDNDAWNAALAINDRAALVGHDHAFENRPDLEYIDFTK